MLRTVNLDIVLARLLASATDVRMPALERWLARGDAGTLAAGSLGEVLALQYGIPEPVPYAAISSSSDLLADPVHIELGQVAAVLHDAAALGITPEEAGALTRDLTRHFKDDGIEFTAPLAHRWSVRVPAGEIPATVPLERALRENTAAAMPRGTGRIKWPAVLTEIQMFLASHGANARREADGKPTINSVWFWGGGTAPASLPPRYALIHAEDAFSRGLATLSGVRAAPVPAGYAGIDAVGANQSVLLVIEDHASEALDERWFVPLSDALRRFDAVQLLLPRGRDTLVARIGRGTRWRWFRGSRPLASHA